MIKVTFEDGTSELRPVNSPAHFISAWRLRDCGLRKNDVDAIERDEFYKLADRRGHGATVWRITGGTEEKAPLTGAWVDCAVEGFNEQIARLEGELAAERATLRVAEDAAEKMRDAFIDFDRSIGEAQGAYCNHEHWGPDQWEPIGDARRDFFKAFEGRRGPK